VIPQTVSIGDIDLDAHGLLVVVHRDAEASVRLANSDGGAQVTAREQSSSRQGRKPDELSRRGT